MTAARQGSTLPAEFPHLFTVDGDDFELPELPARRWLDALAYEAPACWWNLIPGSLVDPGRAVLLDRLVDPDDPFDLDDLETIAVAELDRAIGMDFWAAHRLAAAAYSNWLPFTAWCVAHGTDPLTLSPDRLVGAVWAWRLDNCREKKDFRQLEAEVFAPPPVAMASGRLRDALPTGWTDEQESDMFAAILAGG